MFIEINHRPLKFIVACLFLGFVRVSFGQVTCNHIADSLQLTSDTVYIYQPVDTTTTLGIQWMGYNDLSYTEFFIKFNDSAYVSLSGAEVSGGLQSPYPSPVFFPINIEYLQPSIPANTVINAFIAAVIPNAICSIVPITFIINPSPLSVSEINISDIEASVFPNPMTSSSTIEVSDEVKSGYNVIIYDIAGKEVYSSEQLNSKTYLLNRSIVKSSGIYFIGIESKNKKSKPVKLLVK